MFLTLKNIQHLFATSRTVEENFIDLAQNQTAITSKTKGQKQNKYAFCDPLQAMLCSIRDDD